MSETTVGAHMAAARWRIRWALRWRRHRRTAARIATIARRPPLYVVVRFMLILTGGAAFLSLVAASGLRFNVTRSLPLGLYHVLDRVGPGGVVLRRGMLVMACLPTEAAVLGRRRGYLPRSRQCPEGVTPAGKTILAVGGDTIDVTADGLVLNGVPVPRSSALARDAGGRPLPRLARGRVVVGVGEVWLFSMFNPLSYDSRYYGGVPVARVRAVLEPLWTTAAVPAVRAERESPHERSPPS